MQLCRGMAGTDTPTTPKSALQRTWRGDGAATGKKWGGDHRRSITGTNMGCIKPLSGGLMARIF